MEWDGFELTITVFTGLHYKPSQQVLRTSIIQKLFNFTRRKWLQLEISWKRIASHLERRENKPLLLVVEARMDVKMAAPLSETQTNAFEKVRKLHQVHHRFPSLPRLVEMVHLPQPQLIPTPFHCAENHLHSMYHHFYHPK